MGAPEPFQGAPDRRRPAALASKPAGSTEEVPLVDDQRLSARVVLGQGPAMTADLFDATQPLRIADQGCFFIPGRYTNDGRMAGQVFVQYQVPANRTSPYPLIMIHGGGQIGANFLGTPDGRRGWSDYFVATGFAVYVVDQPGYGRSGNNRAYSPTPAQDATLVAERHTAPEFHLTWPQSTAHTQWPGHSISGDSVFDQYYSAQTDVLLDTASIESDMRDAGAKLLDRIGPSVLLGHSQGARLAWSIGDARPESTRAIVAVEPNGPPLYDVRSIGAPDWFEESDLRRPWGITCGPLTFSPPPADVSEMRFARELEPNAPDLVRCWLQAEPARQLVNLASIPILIITGEASYHTPYDHGTSAFLRQAGGNWIAGLRRVEVISS